MNCSRSSAFGGGLRDRARMSQRLLRLLVLAVICLVPVQVGAGQQAEPLPPPAAQPAPEMPTIESVQQRISEVEPLAASNPDARAQLELLRQALEALQQSEQLTAKISEFQELARGAPERIKEIQARLAEPLAEFKPELPDKPTIEFFRQKLGDAQAAVKAATGLKENVDAEDATRKARREQIPNEVAAATDALEDVQQRLGAPPAADESPSLTQARRWKLLADQQRVQLQINLLQEEIRSYDARRELLPARRQLRERDLIEAERAVRVWQDELTKKEQKEAAESANQASEAIEAAAKVDPLVGKLAQENEELTLKRTELSQRLQEKLKDVADDRDLLRKLGNEYQGIRQQVEQAGLTHAIGVILQARRGTLPDLGRYRKGIRDRQSEISGLQLQWIEYNDRLLSLVDLDGEVARLSEQIEEGVSPEKRLEIEEALRQQLKRQKEEYLPALVGAIDLYLKDALMVLDQVERDLVKLTVEYGDYLAERVLWIKSCAGLEWSDVAKAAGAISWLLDPGSWLALGRAAWWDFRSNWPPTLGWLVPLLLVAGLQRRMRARIVDIATQIKKPTTDRYAFTLEAALWTVLIAAPWPVLLWFISTRISSAETWLTGDEAAFAGALAGAIGRTAWLLFLAEALRQTFRSRGLASVHFRWPEATRHTVRNYLPWIMAVIIPATALVLLTELQAKEEFKESLGRIVFILACLAGAVLIWRLLKPTSGIILDYLSRHEGGWTDRLRYVWFPLLVASPVALAIASALGYHYSALHIVGRIFNTIVLIFAAMILFGLLVRWVFVSQRRIAVAQALKKYAAAERERAESAGEGEVGGPPVSTSESRPLPEEPEVDIVAITAQTRRLLRSVMTVALFIGILLVWSDVLPALGVLRDVVVWSEAAPAASSVAAATSEDGTEVVQTVQQSVVTLADLGLAMVILALTIIVSRNIPGLLEITVLQRLPFTPSGRYGIKTLVQYVIFVVGLILTFNAIGIGWSKVQWLIAAVTVGLGFGLQEIFANFVSGLIILFERPVRVGDVVTVGTTSGVVSRIRIRATTIVDWDRKELIIPNREFVTGQVVNWTLSDAILRVTIPVGVAYGSDTALAQRLLLEIAKKHPNVLDDPPPRALFLGFGDSTLDFELRVFIPHIDYFLAVKSEINFQIDQAFRAAGVEIAFPQRDLHIRSFEAPFPVRMHKPDEGSKDPQ